MGSAFVLLYAGVLDCNDPQLRAVILGSVGHEDLDSDILRSVRHGVAAEPDICESSIAKFMQHAISH